uniref:Fibronectin type-III domain-containing protein n=1 Tax=Syphacia muris TaxID=451379 RepID=A0A0N5AAV2_9BILA
LLFSGYNIYTEEELRTQERTLWKGTPPGRPSVISISADKVILEWGPAIVEPECAPAAELDSDWVRLVWAESVSSTGSPVMYIVEYREIGDLLWYTAATRPIRENSYLVEHLRSNSTYEFRVFANEHGCISAPSPVSEVIQLRPSARNDSSGYTVPAKPQPPEYSNFKGGDRVTLCWFPAESSLPIQYIFEFKFCFMKINLVIIYVFLFKGSFYTTSCVFLAAPIKIIFVFGLIMFNFYCFDEKFIYLLFYLFYFIYLMHLVVVGDLIHGHEYQFRIIAKNSIGFSLPSDSSPPILIEMLTQWKKISDEEDVKFVEAERHTTVPLLQDEIVRESPPLPEHDDSPPPIRRTPRTDVHWRDPTLKEVIEYLDSSDKVEQLNASGYLQHLTYNDNAIKEETRELKGIPKLVRLLNSDVSEIQKNACGCLKNLSFGKENDRNKIAIANAGGIASLSNLLKCTADSNVREEATAALWNLSSCDNLKEEILKNSTDVIVQRVVLPLSGLDRPNGIDSERNYNSNIFMNGTGVLRNVSAASQEARKTLRSFPYLIEALACYLGQAVGSGLFEAPSVENTVCILRNLSYRIQEVVDPNYGRSNTSNSKRSAERSKSAPSGSPKGKRKELKKKKNKADYTGAEMIWDPSLVRLYLKLLQESLNHEILEASAGAIQNLAACDFDPSASVRGCVRSEKGLPILVKLLGLDDDKVVCAVTTALRNLALDSRNRELIGKYAMKDLVSKLPRVGQCTRDSNVGDSTIGAVLGILFETVKHSADFAKNLHDCGGTDRLRFLARSYPTYGARVCKYASQVLYVMWQHKELHDGFRRQGLSESDFYSGLSSRVKESATLARPISSQGPERPAHLRSENMDDSASGYGMYTPGAYSSTYSVFFLKPLYASVNKRNIADESISGNSWV